MPCGTDGVDWGMSALGETSNLKRALQQQAQTIAKLAGRAEMDAQELCALRELVLWIASPPAQMAPDFAARQMRAQRALERIRDRQIEHLKCDAAREAQQSASQSG